MTPGGWASCLDSFADHLEHQQAVLADGRPELVTAFVPATDLGPLPADLVLRSRRLVGQNDALTADLADRLAATAASLAQLHEPAERTRSAYVDSRC